MTFTLSYTSSADEDFEESLVFYLEHGKNLDQRFIDDVQSATEQIIDHPFSFPILFKNARKKSLVNFPFQIIYTVDEKKYEIIIVAVWHSNRNPALLQSRV